MYQTLKIDKTDYPVKFGWTAFYEWELNGGNMANLTKGEVSIKDLFELFHYALKEGAELKGEEYNKEIKETIRLFDSDKKAFDKANALMSESFPKQVTKGE